MNITIAIDSLKGSLSSLEAGHAIEEGIRRVYKDAAVNVRPLADGGEGTVEALACGTPVITFATGGSVESVDETCGKVVPKGDIDALEAAVKAMRAEPDKRTACLTKASHYDKNERFQDYLRLYAKLLHEE